MKTVILSKQQWENRLKAIATKRLRKFKKALTATSMSYYFNEAVIEIHVDSPSSPVYVINIDRYNELRKRGLLT